jgi:predicted Fe-Mo cluster-binding NifX family protein
MTMRLCIPTLDDTGHNAALSDQFGRSPFFTLVDTETQAVEVVPNRDAAHKDGECNPLLSLETERIELVVCQGLGRRAIAWLSEAGIPFFITWKPNVGAVLSAYWAGQLGGFPPGETRQREPEVGGPEISEDSAAGSVGDW